MNPLIQFKQTPILLNMLALLYCGIVPNAPAVVPPPDGGYPGLNTAEGQNALFSLSTGSANTAVGCFSLYSNAENSFNTATGAGALLFNTADNNTAFGAAALLSNTTGTQNTASGALVLLNNTTGSSNTAIGYQALLGNINGVRNNAIGDQALFSHQTGNNNNAVGVLALLSDISGSLNNAIGESALINNTTGSSNTAIGEGAGSHQTTGSGNVYIGALTLGEAGENNTTYIRNVYNSTATARAIYVTSNNKVGTLSSSRRYKEEIKPMDKGSEALFGLKPVTFRYKKEIDREHALSFGLIAEEVAKVSPDLTTYDGEGKPETVRYEAVNAMLLNEFLKEHRTVQELKSNAAKQEATIVKQQKQIDALTAGLQKVSAQLVTASPSLADLN